MKPLVLASNRPLNGGCSPRSDILCLAEALGAEVTYPDSPTKLERALAVDIRQARAAARQSDAEPVLSLSEKVGLPLALIGPKRRHVLVGHHLTSSKKQLMQKATGWLNRLDGIVVLCREQERYLFEEARLPAEKVHFVYDKVDSHFFVPMPEITPEPGLIVSAGRERRDWPTLLEAVKRLPDTRCTIASSSPWSRQGDPLFSENAQVTAVAALPYTELRALYASASVIVVPLEAGVRYAAGVNAVLEARAMGRPVVVTQTPGIAEYLEGTISVPAGDPAALAEALDTALRNPPGMAEIRRLVEEKANLERYVSAVVQVVQS
ncbi:MAG: glycosyltransferase family 4 protein [Armatimonas sp.]